MATRSKASNIFVWIILVRLIAGLAGFGIGGLGGTVSEIGAVGKTNITVQDYQRALQQEINFESRRQQQPVSFLQATQAGLDVRVRSNLTAIAALSEEARVVGLSVGDAEVERQLTSEPAFQGSNGTFNRETYEFTLRQSGLRTSDFETQLRNTAARSLLQQAVTGGVTANPTHADTLFGFLGERRSFRWTALTEEMLVSPVPAPSSAQVAAYFDENSDDFLRPELRRVTYAWLTPDMLVEEIEVDDTELRALYEERAAEYRQPERRMMERLSFPDTAAAEAAKTAINAGETDFDDLVSERGLTLEDVDMGEVARSNLDAAVADVAFALAEPGIAGPVDTSLGPTLFRINAVLDASEVSFEDARAELLRETTSDRARRETLDSMNDVDDLLAGGATLEELATETPLQLGTLDFSSESNDGIAGYENFRAEVAQLSAGDFPEMRELSDGGIFAVRLDEIVAPTLPPLAEIEADVTAALTAAETLKRLREIGENLRDQMAAGTSLESLGLTATTETDARRTTFVEGAPRGMTTIVFETAIDDAALVESNGDLALLEVIDIAAPDPASDELAPVYQQLNDQASISLAGDIFELFGQAVQMQHGLSLDQTAINLVHQGIAGGGQY